MQKSRLLVILSIVVLIALFVAACGNGADAPAAPEGEAGAVAPQAGDVVVPVDGERRTIRIWSFSDEVERFEVIFRGMHPDIDTDFAITDLDGGAYEEWVLTALAAGGDMVPDVLFLEAAIVRHFVEGPFLIGLDDLLPRARELEKYQFVIDIGTYEGEARAFSWQATPGGMFYRRSLARQFFGTDDPAVIQNYFRDIPTTLESGRRIRDESGGNVFLINAFGAYNHLFYANRENRWIENNRLVIDPMVLEYMTFARTIRDEGLDAQVGNWSADWFASMSDDFVDAHGNPNYIFSYILPTWGLAHVIYANAGPETHGDWAIIPGPMPYWWGGTWIGVPRASNNQDLGRLFIESTVLNPEFLSNWALGVYTHEYLLQIDPTLHPGVFQGGGDFVSSAVVVREIADQFIGLPIYYFLGGQNPYDVFGVAAPLIDLRLIQGTDSTIQARFGDAVNQYVNGFMTREEALEYFRDNVHAFLPLLDR